MPLVHLLDPRLAHGFTRRDLIYDLALSYFIITGKSTSFKTIVDSISKDNLGLKKQSRRGVLINVWSKDSEKKPRKRFLKAGSLLKVDCVADSFQGVFQTLVLKKTCRKLPPQHLYQYSGKLSAQKQSCEFCKISRGIFFSGGCFCLF